MKINLRNNIFSLVCVAFVTLFVICGIYFIQSKNAIQTSYLLPSYSYGYSTIQELVNDSDFIAVVEINDKAKEYVLKDAPISQTETNVTVIEPIYNAGKGQKITVVQTGGMVEQGGKNRMVLVKDDPLLKQGEQFLIFAQENSDGTYTILGGPQGRFKLIDSKYYSMRNINADTKIGLKDINGADTKDIHEQVKAAIPNKGVNKRERD